MNYLDIRQLRVRYGKQDALKGVSFSAETRERICLLGPSGCGKTTTLQVIAGFVDAHEGGVTLAGKDILRLAPEKRNIGIMFQNYALFPHMNVYDNVAFGLRMRKIDEADIRTQVTAELERVRLPHAAAKLPSQLSGGEQQRIAFARAVVMKPSLLLLDEPFSNLDARLRQEMRSELLELLSDLPIATVMVTHDQEEAMAIADRIVLMRAGVIEQTGSPAEIYEAPTTLFAARFIGDSNLFRGRVTSVTGEMATVDIAGLGTLRGKASGVSAGSEANVIIRPQRVAIGGEMPEGANRNTAWATVERTTFLGHRTEIHLRLVNGEALVVWEKDNENVALAAGSTVGLSWDVANTLLYPAEA